MTPRRHLATGFIAVLLFAACGSSAATPTGQPSPTASDAPPAAAFDPSVPTACLGLEEPDCGRALEAAVTVLPAARDRVAYVEVGPFGCLTGERCPRNLAARPEGQVLFELGQGDPIAVRVKLAADGSLSVEPGEAFTVKLDPSSLPGTLGEGPNQFSLGHCGLWSGVDVEGAWWDPVGFVDASHNDAINAADGILALTDPNHATFTTPGGLVVNLVRRAGPKHLPLCQ